LVSAFLLANIYDGIQVSEGQAEHGSEGRDEMQQPLAGDTGEVRLDYSVL
jgi:hypothetical protein